GRQPGDVGGRDAVVAHHAHVLPQLAQVLDEVVGERVVVVDHEQHQAFPPEARRATSIALTTTRALLTHSLCSSAGTLSATMPAPAWTYMVSCFATSVRIAMPKSIFPEYEM